MTQIILLETYLTIFNRANLLIGLSIFSACLLKMDSSINGTFLMLLRSGLIVIIHLLKLENYIWIEILKTISLMWNNLLSALHILYPELSLPSIKCFREDYSPMLIHIDTDLETTMIKSQLTALTELEFLTLLEMDGQLLMEIRVRKKHSFFSFLFILLLFFLLFFFIYLNK